MSAKLIRCSVGLAVTALTIPVPLVEADAKQANSLSRSAGASTQAFPTQSRPFLITRPLLDGSGEFFRIAFAVDCDQAGFAQYEIVPATRDLFPPRTHATAAYCNGVLHAYFGSVPYDVFKHLASAGNLTTRYSKHSIGSFEESSVYRVNTFDEEQTLLRRWAAAAYPGRTGNIASGKPAPSPSPAANAAAYGSEITKSAARAFSQSPYLAIGRASGLVKVVSDTVSANEVLATKTFQFVVRNAHCTPARQNLNCKYDLKMLASGTALTIKMPVFDSGWVARSDTFVGQAGSRRSASLDAYMTQWAAQIFRTTPSAGKPDDSGDRSAKQWECRKRALEDGAMAFCPY